MAKTTKYIKIDGSKNTDRAMLDKATDVVMNNLSVLAQRMNPEGREYRRAVLYAAILLRDAIRANAPVSDETHYRYYKSEGYPRGTGKLVARYEPGNLQRSIKVLRHMKDKSRAYVGVEVQPRFKGKGTFSGDRTDGWYARFLEYAPGRKPFMRPAVAANGDKIVTMLRQFVERELKKA